MVPYLSLFCHLLRFGNMQIRFSQFASSDQLQPRPSSSIEDSSIPPELPQQTLVQQRKAGSHWRRKLFDCKYRDESQTYSMHNLSDNSSSWISVTNTDLAAGYNHPPTVSQTVTSAIRLIQLPRSCKGVTVCRRSENRPIYLDQR